MECPACKWKRQEITRQNWVSSQPKDVVLHPMGEVLNCHIEVYRCQNCGHCWPVNGNLEMRKF